MKALGSLTVVLFVAALGAAAPVQSEIFGLSGGGFHVMRYDVIGNSFYDCGAVASGVLTTNLAMDANRRLYYMHPFEGGHVIWQADLDAGNNLINQQVHDTLGAGLSIIDGFTVGPDQQLYMTGYGHSEIYRYVIGSNSGAVTTEVTLSGGGAGGDLSEYRSDLAFDPITGYLVGIGIAPGGVRRTLFQIPGNLATNGVNDSYPWKYFGGNASPWASPTFDLGNPGNPNGPLGPNPDGVAFDPITGELFLSGDGELFSHWDRNNATVISYLNDPSGQDTGMGFDLAFQQTDGRESVPEPATMALLGLGVFGVGRYVRRRGVGGRMRGG